MTEHTPTPWAIRRDIGSLHGPDGTAIITAGESCITSNGPEGFANSLFIAHAVNCHDDLLAACKATAAWGDGTTDIHDVKAQAQAAIDKAVTP